MKPLPWSFSSLSDFNNCAKAFFHKRIAKDVREEQGEAALWGDHVHLWMEANIAVATGELAQAIKALQDLGLDLKPDATEPEIRATMTLAAPRFAAFQRFADVIPDRCPGQLFAERQYAINRKLQPCDWMDPDVWCRGIIDVLHLNGTHAEALDWKTGKRKPNSKQLQLFALLVFLHHPEIQTCSTEFIWLATDEKDEAVFSRDQEAALWQEFLPDLTRYNTAFKQEMWIPRKSGLCKGWCPVTSCEFWEPKKQR